MTSAPRAERPLAFFAFVMNTASHMVHGTWRRADGGQRDFEEIGLWISLAQRLERGGFDALFFADVSGLYGDFRGSWSHHVRTGMQFPTHDPLVTLSALAVSTETLGLALTAGPIQEQPFGFARRMSTLDHISRGRVAWNIVTGGRTNDARNYGLDEPLPHDERYDWADEYLDVLYKLWEGSWEDDALVKDRLSGVYADPEKVHKIHHRSNRYRVEGPHLVSPSPQRTPVLFQAGGSPRGREFAARHAEAQFIAAPRPESARALVTETRALVEAGGRAGSDLLFFQGLSFVVGSTEDEARRKRDELEAEIDLETTIAHVGSALGIDLVGYGLDARLVDVLPDRVNGTRSALTWVREAIGAADPTVADLARLVTGQSRVVGTPEQIADRLAEWRAAGIDGINVINETLPGSYTDFIEHVMPVLRERGLARSEPAAGTLRHRLFGHDRLDDRHPAARHRVSGTPRPGPDSPAPVANGAPSR